MNFISFILKKLHFIGMILLCIIVLIFNVSCEKFSNAVKECIKVFIEEFIEEVHIETNSKMKVKLKGAKELVELSPNKELYKQLINYLDTKMFTIHYNQETQIFVKRKTDNPLRIGE